MSSNKNKCVTSMVVRSQVHGSKLTTSKLSKSFIENVDRRIASNGVPLLLRKLQHHLDHIEEKFNVNQCIKQFEELFSKLESESQVEAELAAEVLASSKSNQSLPKNKLKFTTGRVVNIFGGVEMVVRYLFVPSTINTRTRTRVATNLFNAQMNELVFRCLEILHLLCISVDGVASALANRSEVILHLFTLLSTERLFLAVIQVLEDILGAKKELINLSSIVNLRALISGLETNKLANFCRVLSFTLTDMEAIEDRSTLLAQDEQDKDEICQKDLADINQETLIDVPEFLPKLVELACSSLSNSSLWPSMFSSGREGLMEWLGFHAYLEDLLDLGPSGNTGIPGLSTSLKLIHEVMHKVEVFYVLCLFLTGKHKPLVQKKLSDFHLIPGMSDLFDNIVWLQPSSTRNQEPMEVDSEQECTPETALKIQFLRLVHSFCDRHENKHLLMTSAEIDELEQIYRQNDIETPSSVRNINRKLCCRGEKGLLSKILETLINTPSNASIRFWLSRAIEGFLRGRASFGDQLFLVKRGLLEHLADHIGSSEMKPKEILQSSFDLLGELMKFNPIAFKIFNSVIDDKKFEKFTYILTSNVVDSNMLIRCLILSQERFTEEMPFGDIGNGSCRLGTLINDWEQRMYLLNKLINSITVGTLTQENVSCLNTTLVFLMIAFKQGLLPTYLKAFVREEKIQKNPGFIMKNLRYLLEFWKTHYLKRGKDCSALEQSSCISFDQWKKVVDVLLQDDIGSTSSVFSYLPLTNQAARHC